jgi:hypothetical protein
VADQIFTLIGRMLGAKQRWAEGTVRVHTGAGTDLDDNYVERFWHSRGRWRVERSDGLSFIEHVGVASTTRVADRVERGPSSGIGRFACGRLLEPVNALIWGRPGEDWLPTGQLDALGEGRWKIWLERVDGAYPPHSGYAIVDEDAGFMHELRLGNDSYLLETFNEQDTAGRGEEWLDLHPL